MKHHDLAALLAALAVMLLGARLASEAGRRLRMPAVMAEIGLGILLGPTLLGAAFPRLRSGLFPDTGGTAIALEGFCKVAVVLMMLVAGMEVRLSLVLNRGRAALFTSATSIALPFSIGFLACWFIPGWTGVSAGGDRMLHALFMGTALSITALPVISRILMDMGVFATPVGMTVVASAMVDDIAGWIFFSFILGLMPGREAGFPLFTLGAIATFTALMLTAGRKAIHLALGWMRQRVPSPGAALSLTVGVGFLCASSTEAMGLHAILGAFIAGIAIGDSTDLPGKARELAVQFITHVFAPLYFVSIGLRLDFAAHFDLPLVLLVLALAFAGKLSGAWLGARMGGFRTREALAIAFGMNARGAMEIILGKAALEAGLIGAETFVALVVMAVITSLAAGPMMRICLGPQAGDPGIPATVAPPLAHAPVIR